VIIILIPKKVNKVKYIYFLYVLVIILFSSTLLLYYKNFILIPNSENAFKTEYKNNFKMNLLLNYENISNLYNTTNPNFAYYPIYNPDNLNIAYATVNITKSNIIVYSNEYVVEPSPSYDMFYEDYIALKIYINFDVICNLSNFRLYILKNYENETNISIYLTPAINISNNAYPINITELNDYFLENISLNHSGYQWIESINNITLNSQNTYNNTWFIILYITEEIPHDFSICGKYMDDYITFRYYNNSWLPSSYKPTMKYILTPLDNNIIIKVKKEGQYELPDIETDEYKYWVLYPDNRIDFLIYWDNYSITDITFNIIYNSIIFNTDVSIIKKTETYVYLKFINQIIINNIYTISSIYYQLPIKWDILSIKINQINVEYNETLDYNSLTKIIVLNEYRNNALYEIYIYDEF